MYLLYLLLIFLCLVYIQSKDLKTYTIDLTRDPNKHILYEVISPINKTYLLDYKEKSTPQELFFENTDLFSTKISIGSQNDSLVLIPDFQKFVTFVPCGLSYISSLSKSYNSSNLLFKKSSTNSTSILGSDSIILGNTTLNLSFLNEYPCEDPHQSLSGYLGLSAGIYGIECIKNNSENSSCSQAQTLLLRSDLKNNFKQAGFTFTKMKLLFSGEYNGSLMIYTEENEKIYYNICSPSNKILSPFWHCDLSGLFLIGQNIQYKELSNVNVIFDPSLDYLKIPFSYYSLFYPLFITKCIKEFLNQSSFAIICEKDFNFYDFPIIGFHINNFVYKIDPINLFWKTDNGFTLKILFVEEENFILGLPFLKQYETVYNTDNLKVGFNKNSPFITSYAELKRSYIVLFLTIAGIIFFLLVVLIIVILRLQITKQKRMIKEEMSASLIKNDVEPQELDTNFDGHKEKEFQNQSISQNIQISTF